MFKSSGGDIYGRTLGAILTTRAPHADSNGATYNQESVGSKQRNLGLNQPSFGDILGYYKIQNYS